MLDEPGRYPLLRRRRRRRNWKALLRPRAPSGRARRVALAVLGVALLAALAVALRRPAPADPRQEVAASLAASKRGNYSAARNHAQRAIKADPSWGLAHAVLARAYLLFGDGTAAEGELTLARADGFDMARAHPMLAEAYLLQGDADRALAEAAQAGPRDAGYAVRVRARAMAAKDDVPGASAVLAALLAETPDNSLAWSDLGRIRADAGDVAGASAATGHALAADPNNLAAIVLRGELVRTQFGLAAALPWFEAALGRDAYFLPALIDYAATLGEVGRYADMLAATRKALAAQPGNPQALYLQAVLAARAGNRDLARSMLERTGGQIDGMPGVLLLGGTLDYADGAYEQAAIKWRTLLEQQPMNFTARRLLGAALLRSGDAHGALDVLRPVALRTDADSYTLALVGRAFEATGNRAKAGLFLDRADRPATVSAAPFGMDDDVTTLAGNAADAPGDPAEAVDLIRGLLEEGNSAAALARARAMAAAGPGVSQVQVVLGDVLASLGQWPAAVTAYARAANLRFDEPAMLKLVDAQARAGQGAQASRTLALYLSQNPQSVAGARMAGHLQIATGQWQDAIDTLESLRVTLGNRDAGLLADLSAAYLGAGDAARARDYARAAYALSPLNPGVADTYGRALFQLHDDAGARQLLRKAAALAPADPVVREHLADALAG